MRSGGKGKGGGGIWKEKKKTNNVLFIEGNPGRREKIKNRGQKNLEKGRKKGDRFPRPRFFVQRRERKSGKKRKKGGMSRLSAGPRGKRKRKNKGGGSLPRLGGGGGSKKNKNREKRGNTRTFYPPERGKGKEKRKGEEGRAGSFLRANT